MVIDNEIEENKSYEEEFADAVLEKFKKHGIEATRENYLDYIYLGDVPEWGAELESMLPERFKIKD